VRKHGFATTTRGINHASIHNRRLNSSCCSFLFYAKDHQKQQKQIRRLFRLFRLPNGGILQTGKEEVIAVLFLKF